MKDGYRPAMAAMLAAAAAAAAPIAMADPFAYTIVDARAVPAALGGLSGDARRGAEAAAAHCAACHETPRALDGLMPGTIRLAIIDRAVLDPDAGPHAFYVPDAEGRTALSAQTIEDIVVFLAGDRSRRDP